MKSLRMMLAVVLVSLATVAVAQSDAPPSDAEKSFDKMKTLAGTWEGKVTVDPPMKDMAGNPLMRITLRETSRGNALVHEMKGAGDPDDPKRFDHPVTMVYVDGDKLTLTHYCDAGNRPRMVAKRILRSKGGGVRFGGRLRQHRAWAHGSRRVYGGRPRPSHRGLDLHDAGGQAYPRAHGPATCKVTLSFTKDELETRMDREWNDSQPIYRQLRDRVVAMILDGLLKEGDPLPSVRNVAAEYRVNPLTVLKGYQQLVDEGLVETRRGRGMFINAGARSLLLKGERQKFLTEEWPRIKATIERLGLTEEELLNGNAKRHTPKPSKEER